MIAFSPSTRGFYNCSIHAKIPADAVDISEARHRQLIEAQAQGKTLYVDQDGTPRFRQEAPTVDELRSRLCQQINREAALRIAKVSPIWRQLNDARTPTAAGKDRFARIDAIRKASNSAIALLADLPAEEIETFNAAEHPAWPQEPAQ